jgi:hypothetical protein
VYYANAYAMAGTPLANYATIGLMGETVWGELLADLYAESYIAEVDEMSRIMRGRQEL